MTTSARTLAAGLCPVCGGPLNGGCVCQVPDPKASPVTCRITTDDPYGPVLVLHQRGSSPEYVLRVSEHQRGACIDLGPESMRTLANALIAGAFLVDGGLVVPASNLHTVI